MIGRGGRTRIATRSRDALIGKKAARVDVRAHAFDWGTSADVHATADNERGSRRCSREA